MLTDNLIAEHSTARTSDVPAGETSSANVAVVGCGYWGKNLVRNFAHLRALRVICDSNEKSLQAQGSLYPNVQLTSDLDSVLADSKIKAVVLATPAALHYTQVKQVLDAGKDVFVEKPLASTPGGKVFVTSW